MIPSILHFIIVLNTDCSYLRVIARSGATKQSRILNEIASALPRNDKSKGKLYY